MTELPEHTNDPAPAAATTGATQPKPYWLYRFAAWVVIVAGIVFIASTVFFTGTYVGRGGHHHCHHHHSMKHMGHMGHHKRGPGPAVNNQRPPGPEEAPASVAPSVTPGR